MPAVAGVPSPHSIVGSIARRRTAGDRGQRCGDRAAGGGLRPSGRGDRHRLAAEVDVSAREQLDLGQVGSAPPSTSPRHDEPEPLELARLVDLERPGLVAPGERLVGATVHCGPRQTVVGALQPPVRRVALVGAGRDRVVRRRLLAPRFAQVISAVPVANVIWVVDESSNSADASSPPAALAVPRPGPVVSTSGFGTEFPVVSEGGPSLRPVAQLRASAPSRSRSGRPRRTPTRSTTRCSAGDR